MFFSFSPWSIVSSNRYWNYWKSKSLRTISIHDQKYDKLQLRLRPETGPNTFWSNHCEPLRSICTYVQKRACDATQMQRLETALRETIYTTKSICTAWNFNCRDSQDESFSSVSAKPLNLSMKHAKLKFNATVASNLWVSSPAGHLVLAYTDTKR